MDFIYFILTQIKTNQFASAAIVAGIMASLVVWTKQLPGFLFNKIRNTVMISVRANSDTSVYRDLLLFLTETIVIQKLVKHYTLDSRDQVIFQGVGKAQKKIRKRFTYVGYGRHLGIYKGKIVFISRRLQTNNTGDDFKETCVCNFLFASRFIANHFMDDLLTFVATKNESDPGIDIKFNSGDKWSDGSRLPLRSIDTIFTRGDIEHIVLAHIQNFDANKDIDHKRGLPHRTGVLLVGPSGTGKSSIIHAIASETQRTIYFLDLSKVTKLSGLLDGDHDWNKALLVVEDIDATGLDLNRDTDSRVHSQPTVSLSTLLNFLDGLVSPDGLVVMATTNHPERLDPALKRPGRFDLLLEVGHLTKREFVKMAALFDIDATEYSLPYFEPTSGATLRMLLLQGGMKAVENYQKDNKKE